MTAALLGAVLGLGMWLMVTGLRPARPSLGEALAILNRAPAPAPVQLRGGDGGDVDGGVLARLGRPLARVLGEPARSRITSWVESDLRVIEQSSGTYVAEVLGGCLVMPLLAYGVVRLIGSSLPPAVQIALILGSAALGWPLSQSALRTRARARRAEFRFALSGFVDLVHSGVGAGRTVDEAVASAADASDSWACTVLRRTLASARARKEASWTALGRLGSELSIPELEELAANVDLAARRGGQVLRTLAARADTLRSQRMAEARASAHRASQRLTLPLCLMAAGFLLFLMYPPLGLTLGS